MLGAPLMKVVSQRTKSVDLGSLSGSGPILSAEELMADKIDQFWSNDQVKTTNVGCPDARWTDDLRKVLAGSSQMRRAQERERGFSAMENLHVEDFQLAYEAPNLSWASVADHGVNPRLRRGPCQLCDV